MIYYYSLGFDMTVSPMTSFSLSVQRNGVTETITVSAADIITELGANKATNSGQCNYVIPYDPINATTAIYYGYWSDISFVSALHDALKVKTDAASWAFHIEPTLGNTGKLTLASSDSSSQFYVIVNNATTQAILGHITSNNGTTTASREGYYPMQFCVVPTIQYPSEASGLYEPGSMRSLSIPVSGAMPYGMSRSHPIAYSDWKHYGEPKSSIYSNTVATHPYGFDFLYAWCGQGYPFVAEGDTEDTVHMLRSDSAFNPSRLIQDYDDLWQVDLKTVYLGKVTYP